MAFGCEVLFDAERAKAMQEMVEEAVGGPCPCRQNQPCPLLPRDLTPLRDSTPLPAPMVRAS